MDDDQEKRALRALCEEFKKAMHQQVDALEFDYEVKVRLGHIIGRAALNDSEYPAYPAVLLQHGPSLFTRHGRSSRQSPTGLASFQYGRTLMRLPRAPQFAHFTLDRNHETGVSPAGMHR
jgi:hypothetical protein